MSNKKNKEIEIHDSESEEEQESGSERDSDFDSDGNYVGDKVSSKHNLQNTWHAEKLSLFIFYYENISIKFSTALLLVRSFDIRIYE